MDHSIPGQGEDRLAFDIPVLLLRVNPTIEFNAEATLGPAAVDDEGTDGMLPAEFQSIQATTG